MTFLGLFSLMSSAGAQQPAAVLVSLVGDVSVSIQGGSPRRGNIGMTLHEGDSIRTRSEANAIVELSDRSTLELAENTAVTISILVEDSSTGASRSNLDLWWGSLRSVVPVSQTKNPSSITVQTSNARTDLTSPPQNLSVSDSQVIFDPQVNTTTAIAHKFDVVVTNLLTEESLLIPEGSVGFVHQNSIQKVAMKIHFPAGDDNLTEIIRAQGAGEDTMKAQLDRIADILKQIPGKIIILEGHTDDVGSEQENMRLGQSRADSVKTYFIEQHGIPPGRFETISYGATRPIASNETEQGRAQNRRVEIR